MHKRLSASRFVTLEGSRTHGVFGDPEAGCANAVVLKYLADGKLPTPNITCQKS
ncbi:alpha/beta hydrolase [Kribbella sp. NBC_01245]|uniref:alpha/beta hydrolase n=1 Tax=Kribbella sp. NBC_01245 TaxID=2903578 RepID=UPI002E2800BD|nr:alpha/beta hydrolase [Kribbella sp. NBC_01245]